MVAENIRRLCKEKGVSVAELERTLDLKSKSIFHLSNNSKISTLSKIAKELGTTLEELLKE